MGQKTISGHNFNALRANRDNPTAALVLEDGTIFTGFGFGAAATNVGEVCFNTSMTGYQEIMTDPSYYGQIVVMTYPLIGNYGVNNYDYENKKSHIKGFVVRECNEFYSNWRSDKNFSEWLKDLSIPGIAGIDTRKLTKIIRNSTSTNAIIAKIDKTDSLSELNEILQNHPSMNGLELFSKISTKKEYFWNENLHELIKLSKKQNNKQLKIIAFDYGVKSNILRNLYDRNFEVSVLPYTTTIEEIISKNPDGIFLSNGPGDPKASDPYVFKLLKNLTSLKIPIFGICIGHQLIALTLGAKTSKMRQGHRGSNHPVKNLETNSVEITSQNHGFIVDKQSLPSDLQITHISLFDQSIEGLKHRELPIFSVQFHPEASPGPTDTSYLFDKFYNLCLEYSNAKKN